MELLKNLFEGYPDLCGGGVAHSVLILSLVIAFGIMLAKIKVAGVSLGITWILFVGIVFGHFDMTLNEHLLHFMKEFGLTAKARQHIKKLDTPDEETPLDSFLKGQMDKARKESR